MPSIAPTISRSWPRPSLKWITRVPATLSEAQAVLAQRDPQTMAPLTEGYRYRELPSTYGGVAQRWVLIYSEQRQPQAQRTVDKQWRKQSDQEVKAFKTLCRTAFACEADAQQALATFCARLAGHVSPRQHRLPHAPLWQAGATPAPDAQPARWSTISQEPWLRGSRTIRRASTSSSCFILATNELDEGQLPPQAVLDGYKGQAQAERGFRFLKDPQFLASSLYLKKPERIMALLMVMTVCLLVYAALEYRIRTGAQGPRGDLSRPKRANAFRTRLHGGCFTTLWGFMCSTSQDKGSWSSI